MLRSVKYGVLGAVLAGLVAAPAVWASADKTVHLVVDGHAHALRTSAEHVGSVVRQAGFRVTGHDILAPSASARVHDGEQIVLRRGRQLRLDVDGRRIAVWTTAPTVQTALAELGYTRGAFVSVSRSTRLPLTATSLAIRTPRSVLVVHDGKREQVTTTAPTVGALMTALDIRVGANDLLSSGVQSPLTTGQVVTLQRVHAKRETRTVDVPYTTVRNRTASLFVGETKIVRPGHEGRARKTYQYVYIDGVLTGTTVVSQQTITATRDKVLSIGTRKVTGSGPRAAQAMARILLAKRGWSDQMDCLVSMWNRESRWNVHAANPSGAYGIPQSLPGSKMAAAGSDWQDSAATQIKWGLGYIAARYGTPCGAWSFWQAHNYY